MDSIYEAVKKDRAKNNASDFAGIRPSILQAARASLAQPKDDEANKQQEIPKQVENAESEIATPPNAHNTAAVNPTDETSPNTKSVMFEHLKAQEQQQEQQEQNQQIQEQDKQQDEQLTLVRGLGHYQHEEKRERDITNEHTKMRENPDLLLIRNNGQYLLLTTRELFERNKDKSIEEQIEFAKNAVNYTQSVEVAKKRGKSEAAFMKELGLPFSIKNERLERLRKQYMENQTSFDYNQRNAHLKDRSYYNEIQEAFEGVDSSSIAAMPTLFVWKAAKGLFGFASEGSIPVTREQSVDEQMLALQELEKQQELMSYIHSLKSNFKEESVISNVYHSLRGNDDTLKTNKNNAYKRILENLQQEMPSITKVGEMEDGSFFIDFPDNQRMFFKDNFLDYLDTKVKNNQMEAAAGIVAALVAAPLAAYAGAGAAGGFLLTTAAGAAGSMFGADMDFKRIAAKTPTGTYTSEDWGTKVRDAAALSIVGDLAIGGAIWGAKAAWRAIPTAEKGAIRYGEKNNLFNEEVDSIVETQQKYFTIDKAQQSFMGALMHGRVKNEGLLNRLEAGLQAQSVSPTAKRLGSVMNDTIADNVFRTNKNAQELFDSLLSGDTNRVAQLERDIAEITQDLKNRFNEVEKIIKDNVPLKGAIPEEFIDKVERDVARTISATDTRLHSTLDDIFTLMRNAGDTKDLIEIEKFVGQALVENYKHYSATKILNHVRNHIANTIDEAIKSAFKNMPELGENLIKQRAALKAEWRNFAFQKSRVGFDEMSQSFRQHQNLDNFVHAAQANVTHDDVVKGFAKEPQKRSSYSIGEKEMSESELEGFLQTLGNGRENVELIVLNGIVQRAEKKIGKDFVVDNMGIYNDLKSINPDLFKSDKGKQLYQILDELATQFKHDMEILRFAGRDIASEEFKYWGMQPLIFKILSRFFNSLRARFSDEAGYRYCLKLAMERPRSFKEIGEILGEQSKNPSLTPQDKQALLETSKLMLKVWREREDEIAKKEAAEKKARELKRKEKLARDKENVLRTSGDDVSEDILPTEDLGTRIDNAETMVFSDKDKGYPASYQIVDSNQLSASFEYGINYQFREIKQTETINKIRDHFDPKLIFTREGGFDGLPVVDNKGRTMIGNHRLEALQHLSDENWEKYAKEVFLKYGAKLERGQLLVRVLEPSIGLRARIALAKAGNESRVHTDTERSLVIVGKYSDSINALINATSPVQPAFKDAANVNEMRALVAAAMNDPLEKEATNHALLLALCPELLARKRLLHREMPDVAEIIQQMLNDNAGALLLNAISPNAKNIDISKYLAGSLGRIAEARKFDKQRRDRFIQSSVENLNIDFKNIYDSEKVNGISAFEQFKADLIALALARFSKRENPSGNLYAFLKEIGEKQEHSNENLFGEEYATTLWDNLLRINRIDLENGEVAIALDIKKILTREKEYLSYKEKREIAERQIEQLAFKNELLSTQEGRNALQFAMQTKMYGTQSEQNIAKEIPAKQGYYLNHDGALSIIEGKAKPENPIDVVSKNAEMVFGTDTPFVQQMKEGFINDNIKQKWWIVPRGQRSIVEYAKEIDPSLVSFESAEIGSWYADVQGIVHKVAMKNQDMLAIEHYASNEIPPAKTWFFKNDSQITHLMQAYNGEVLLVDTLNKDNTRTILAKNKDTIVKTTIDESGNATTTHEEASKSIEFSRFLQESEGIETAGKGELQSTFQALSDKEIREIVSQWDLENPRTQDRVIIEKISDIETEQLQKEFNFKNKKQLVREIDAQHLRHSINRHGDDVNSANISINIDDILGAYPKITKDFDKRVITNNNTIIYAKQINGHFVAIEEALVGQDKLRFVTAWKTRGKLNEEVLFKNVKAFPNRQDVHKVASDKRNLELSQDGTSHNQSLDNPDSTPPPIKDSLENGDMDKGSAPSVAPPKHSIATNDVAPTDYAIDVELASELAARSGKQRLADNLEALRTLGELAKGEPLNAARQQSLARYSGFGGLMVKDVEGLRQLLLPIAENDAFVQHALLGKNLYDVHHRADILYSQIAANADNSYYTPHAIISAIWEHLGFVKGRVLEPSMGIGNFYTAMPRDIFGRVQKVGIEIDPIAAAIGKQLSPNVDVQAKSFYDFKSDVGFDLVIGNPPYGEHLKDFILKSVDSAKENGIIVQVVSNAFLDNAASRDVRAAIADKAELLGAVRLPSKTFSGTDIATDIVVFQKRSNRKNSTYWRGAKTYKEDSELTLNNYYHENPEHILGELAVGTTQYGQRWIVKQGDDMDNALHENLAAILSKRENESDSVLARESDVQEMYFSHAVDVNIPNTFFLAGDTIFQAQKYAEPSPVDFLAKVQGNGAAFEQLSKSAQTRRKNEAQKAQGMAKDYIRLRDSLLALRSSEALETTSEESLNALRKELNDCYDSFVQKFGKVSENALLKKVFAQDPSFSSVVDLDARSRHQILDSRVIFPYQIPTKARDIQDAIAISKGYAGRISEDYINTLLGDRYAVQKALNNGELFADAKGNLFTKDAFIVGDLGARIDSFKALKELNPQQKRALETLEAALPEPLEIQDIYYHPSSSFIPKEAMLGFFDSLGVKATYYKPTNSFIIDHKSGSHTFQTAYSAITDKMEHSATVVLESLLKNKPLRFSKQIAGVKQSYPEQFAANKMAQDKLLDCFYAYMQKHHAKDIANSYNHTFRRIVANDFQGEPILYGANPDIKLHPHQKSAIAFATSLQNVLLDHSVGAGKTFEMIAIASEWKRLGISKNPLFVVPNHLVEQWAKSFDTLYPASRVLLIPTNDMERKKTLAMLANGGNDFDAVIMPHSTFDSIHLSNEKSAQYVYEELKELEQFEKEMRRQRSKDPLTKAEQKRLEKSIAKKKIALQEKYDKLLETKGAKEESIAFEELGFDSLFVDEAHAYKNLGFLSANRNIRGMGNSVGSQKALNLLYKVKSMQEHEQRIVFATGTPLSNSVSEVYTWQRFLAPQFLKDNKIATFDRWITLFGQVSSELERTPVGTYKDIMRLRSFKNTSELSTLYRQFAHYVDVSQTHIKRPNVEQVSIQCPSSPQQKEYMQHLLQRYEALSEDKTIEGFENDNFLNITTDGIHAALDYRLIDKSAEDFGESKINRATSEMLKLYKESSDDLGTQLVFIDRSTPKPKRGIRDEIRNVFEEYYHAKDEKTEEILAQKLEEMAEKHHYSNIDEMRNAVYSDFSLYEDMRDKLIKSGIPKEQIAFIHDYTTDAQKAQLFADVNAGKIRFLFGSTKKMGAGMNVQERIVGLHHIDAAWNPADMEQRNLLAEKYADFKIKIFRYVTENSCDAVYYSKLEQKANSIKSFRSGHAQKDELGDDVILTLEELKALATGDTRELEKASLNKELQNVQYQLNALKSADAFQEIERQNRTKDIKILPQEIANLKHDLDIAKQRKLRKLSEDEKESLRNLDIAPDSKEPLFRLDNYDVFLEKSPRGIYTLSAISDNGNEIVLLKQSEPPKNLAHYAQKLIEQSSAAKIETRIAKKESELKNAQESLKSIEQSTTGKEIAQLEAKEKELSGKIARLIKEMSAQPQKQKEEIKTLENGTILFKDKNGKEHTISKEIQEQWISTFGLKNIEESIEIALPRVVGEKIGKNIHINVGSLLKMVAQKREKYISELAQVLQKPELVLGDDTILILARHLKDNDFFVNVSVDKGEYFVSISNGIKEANNLRNKIQNGMKILYQSPNANSNLQTLLQASRYSTNKTDKGNSTTQSIKNSLEKGETHASLQQQLKKLEQQLTANREKIDKAMPEDTRKLREIQRELVLEKRRIRAEIVDKTMESLQNLKAEDRSEAMSVNWDLANEVGMERFLKVYAENKQKQEAIHDFIDSINQRPDVEYTDKNGTIMKVKKVLDTSANSLNSTLRPEAQTTKDEVQYFILSDDKGQMSFNQLGIETLLKELKEAKEIRLRDTGTTTIHSNLHAGSGIVTGSIAGLETDEQGNISFSPEKFVLGFLAGAAGSKAISSALQHLKNNPEHKKQAIDIIAQSLAQSVPDTLKKYPLLELVLPRKMSTSAQGLQAQTQTMISKLEQKEKRGLFNVVYNNKNATKIYKDLERIDEAIVLERGTKKKGAAHIRIKHSTDTSQEGYVTPLEVTNLGKDVRAFLKKYNEPFIDSNKARIYEWENSEKVRFRLVVNDTSSGNSNLPSASGDIITFYSDRNLKNPMQFKNPALRGTR